MNKNLLSAYRCPVSGASLELKSAVMEADDEIVSGSLLNPDGDEYPINNGIPDFTYPLSVRGPDRERMAEYDYKAANIYDSGVDWLFTAFHADETALRSELIDRLNLEPGSCVLEVGCGTGRDTVLLRQRLPQGRLFAQDLSSAMVGICRQRLAATAEQSTCTVQLFRGNGAYLPFPDGSFDAVFHTGGINEFSDKARALREMVRVTRVGGRAVIADEAIAPWLRNTEYARILSNSNPLFLHEPPLELLPANVCDVRINWLLGNAFYAIDFSVADRPPEVDMDLPHQGRRGGTLRTRYFGQLEGVTPETKHLAEQAAAKQGVSMHQWLDELVRDKALQALQEKSSDEDAS